MSEPRIKYLMFDFFGTLVEYSASRVEQGFDASHRLIASLGADLTYQQFLDAWSRCSMRFEQASAVDGHEYAMTDVAAAFLRDALSREPADDEIENLVAQYLAEWSKAVRYPDGIATLLAALAARHSMAVVSNTHHAPLVTGHLSAMGVLEYFDAVVTSVEVGRCKPDPRIYAAALASLGAEAGATAFIGDSWEPDYVGPTRAGMTSYLIDPAGQAPIPDTARLTSVFDLPARLSR